MGVLTYSNMPHVAPLPHDQVMRIIPQTMCAHGTLKHWQAIVSTDFDETDIVEVGSSKGWQELSPGDDKAKRVADFGLATLKFKTKCNRAIENVHAVR